MDAAERAKLIKQYKAGYRQVKNAFADVTEEELDRSAEEGWTPRMIAHHLGDSEMTSAIRLRRLLADADPVIQGYDQEAFAAKLTGDRPVKPSLEAMRWARESTAQLLDRLTDADWARRGTHTEIGPYSMEDWLVIYANHGHDHAAQVRRARGKA